MPLSDLELLQGLVSIPSLSYEESEAAHWLVDQMRERGFTRAFVDEAGNAVGELGDENATHTLVLLGHIDTVPGQIQVRIENDELWGRGSVDAKGPLATFTCAASRICHELCVQQGWRVIVVGAVEEEAATSKGARYIRDRFASAPPDACIIGEPSTWNRATLGYKGRILIDFRASQPTAHSAGPESGVGTLAFDFWHALTQFVTEYNDGKEKIFDQLLPSLRSVNTEVSTDESHDLVKAFVGLRLPPEFDIKGFGDWLTRTASAIVTADQNSSPLGEVSAKPTEGVRHVNPSPPGPLSARMGEGENASTSTAPSGHLPLTPRGRIGGASDLSFPSNEGEVARPKGATVEVPKNPLSQPAAASSPKGEQVHCSHGPFSKVTIRAYAYEPAYKAEKANKLVSSFLKAVRTIDNEAKPGFVYKTGTSDMNVVGPAWKCPIFAYGPGDSSLDHTPVERVNINEFALACNTLEQTIRNFIGA